MNLYDFLVFWSSLQLENVHPLFFILSFSGAAVGVGRSTTQHIPKVHSNRDNDVETSSIGGFSIHQDAGFQSVFFQTWSKHSTYGNRDRSTMAPGRATMRRCGWRLGGVAGRAFPERLRKPRKRPYFCLWSGAGSLKPCWRWRIWILYNLIIFICLHMGLSENVVYPIVPMVLLIIIPMKNGYFIGTIPYFQTNPFAYVYQMSIPCFCCFTAVSACWYHMSNVGNYLKFIC